MRGIRRYESVQGFESGLSSGGLPSGSVSWEDAADICASGEEMTETLKSTIEGEIIPRLMLAHKINARDRSQGVPQPWSPDEDMIENVARIVLEGNDAKFMSHIEQLRDNGVTLEQIYLNILTPTAHYLGDLWKQDQLHFVDVTVGLARIQALLRQLSREFSEENGSLVRNASALLLVHPKEQHTCGMLMVAEFFRREGWSVWCGAPKSEEEYCDLVSNDWFDFVGFSISRDELAEKLKEDISKVRQASKNQSVPVFVGGRAFIETPSLTDMVGADVFARDGLEALVKATKMIETSKVRC